MKVMGKRQALEKVFSKRDLVILRGKWSEREVVFIEENYGSLTLKDIAKRLNRSPGGIKYMIRVLQLENIRPSWSKKQIRFLKTHKDWTVPELAKKIGKSKNAVRKKLARL